MIFSYQLLHVFINKDWKGIQYRYTFEWFNINSLLTIKDCILVYNRLFCRKRILVCYQEIRFTYIHFLQVLPIILYFQILFFDRFFIFLEKNVVQTFVSRKLIGKKLKIPAFITADDIMHIFSIGQLLSLSYGFNHRLIDIEFTVSSLIIKYNQHFLYPSINLFKR